MTKMNKFHNLVLIYLAVVGCLVSLMIFFIYLKMKVLVSNEDSSSLEVVWTLMPAAILVSIAFPSLSILYKFDESSLDTQEKSLVKMTGHQWYWHYEYYLENEYLDYDSFMMPLKEVSILDLRCLETDSSLMLFCGKLVRMLVSSDDVLHSFAVPGFGFKMDAVPGRLNQQVLEPNVVGMFYGQCSEMCGANHSFMPMTVEVVLQSEDLKKGSTSITSEWENSFTKVHAMFSDYSKNNKQ